MPEGRRLSLKDGLCPGDDVCILIGPEGDFFPGRSTCCGGLRFCPRDIGGANRLRTETARAFSQWLWLVR